MRALISPLPRKKKDTPDPSPRPFLKWVGGKRSILPALLRRFPKEYDSYCEPFVGGGALFFASLPKHAYLSDVNAHLIATYTAVKEDVTGLVQNLALHQKKHSPSYFVKARKRLLLEKDGTKVAAWMIYLNKTCFNGLFRVSKSGRFNVPIGSYAAPCILDASVLLRASQALQTATLTSHSFQEIPIQAGRFYYLDPPYHKTYASYDGSGFGEREHCELAEKCREIDKAGAYFMLSNSDTDFVRSLYAGFRIEPIAASRSVSCKSSQRGRAQELLIRNYKR